MFKLQQQQQQQQQQQLRNLKMWADRDMDEHSVFDHKPRENGINHHPQYHHHHVPMTGGDNRIYSGLPIGGNGAPGGRIISPGKCYIVIVYQFSKRN